MSPCAAQPGCSDSSRNLSRTTDGTNLCIVGQIAPTICGAARPDTALDQPPGLARPSGHRQTTTAESHGLIRQMWIVGPGRSSAGSMHAVQLCSNGLMAARRSGLTPSR